MMGWKMAGTFPFEYGKAILLEAPHTSGWDFLIGWAGLSALGIRVRFLIKKEMFVFPLGPLIRAMGAIPVDRGKRNNMVDYVSELFGQYDSFYMVITPEGTRKYSRHWKKGFYHISLKAGVPVVLCYLDYGKKEGGIGPVIWPSGDYEVDFKAIEDFYRGRKAKFPENFNLS